VVRADGLAHPDIAAGAPYGLILCNLLAQLLLELAADIHRCLQPGGFAVLSGILAWKYPQVTEACKALHFEIVEEIEIREWRAMTVRRA